jgi:methylisocitrate lyase
MASRPAQLRRLIADHCVAMPGAFNAMTARLIERAGFEAVYVSGAGLTNATAGVPDIGLVGMDEWVRLVGYICDATSLPVVADVDTGFGGPSNVARTVRELERVGLAGLHLEDQDFPKRCGHLAGKDVVPADEMCAKLEAAVSARRDNDFLIIARTDARAVEGFDGAVERARRYLTSGADAIFPEAMQSADEFKRFAKAIGAPETKLLANMTEFGKTPLLSVDELAAMGYRMAIFPQTAFRLANKAMLDGLVHLKQHGTQKDLLEKMQTRQELYDVLHYDPNAEVWMPDASQE